ncbi:hypothetical protein RF11_03080 [Thelohanellus kitauei]|uniref:Uncharacterized protein n=1 Tax=Thelohanellus kitauei TaxID=669202 RepID=A0A0C2MR61_THEKT|nr:hypothetical protein RF11_03080 [Thelohanellus kitauei]
MGSDESEHPTEFLEPISTSTISTISTTQSSLESNQSTESLVDVSTTNHGWKSATQISMISTTGFLSSDEEISTNKSVSTISTDNIGTTLTDRVSHIDEISYFETESTVLNTKSASKVTPGTNRVNTEKPIFKIKKIQFENPNLSQPPILAFNIEKDFTNAKSSIELKSKIQNHEYSYLRDILLLSCLVMAIICLVYEIHRRRKISRRLRSYLFRV